MTETSALGPHDKVTEEFAYCPYGLPADGTPCDDLHQLAGILSRSNMQGFRRLWRDTPLDDFERQAAEKPDAWARLYLSRRLSESVERAMQQLADEARADGLTWEQVGEALGVTRQAAQQRFGR